MSYTLINFNMPLQLKDSFDQLLKLKRVSRTAALNSMVEAFCRKELRMIKDDRQLNGELRSLSSEIKYDEDDEPLGILHTNDNNLYLDDGLRL